MSIRESNRRQFESMGVEQVRLSINTKMVVPEMLPDAIRWLAQRDEEERSRNDSSQALQAEAASRAAPAAERASAAAERAAAAAERQAAAAEEANRFARTANKRATIAIIIAITGAIISVISPGLVHWDATHPNIGPSIIPLAPEQTHK